MKIYLDVCCLCRPFDDKSQDRVRLEAEAVFTILEHCKTKEWSLIGSEVVDIEISKIINTEKRTKVSSLTSISLIKIDINEQVKNRAIEIRALRFSTFDALHISCAEQAQADIMLTTDDNLLKKASQNLHSLKVNINNPVVWLIQTTKQ